MPKKKKWLEVYEAFSGLTAREKCCVLEAAYIPIPRFILAGIDFEKHFGKIKIQEYVNKRLKKEKEEIKRKQHMVKKHNHSIY